MGIRPEDVIRLPDDKSGDSLACVPASVEDVEQFGDTTVTHWDLGDGDSGHRIVVLAKSSAREPEMRQAVSADEMTTLGFDMSRAHWFRPCHWQQRCPGATGPI